MRRKFDKLDALVVFVLLPIVIFLAVWPWVHH